jgi:hypothetical protein
MKTKILSLLALLLVLFFSCRDYSDITKYFELTEAEKRLIPYELGQIVSFIDSTGQSFDVTVTENTIYWESSVDPDPYYAVYTQVKTVRLQSDDVNFNIILNISGGSFTIYSYIHFDLWFYLGYKRERFVTEKPGVTGAQYLHNRLEINNKIYYDVVEKIMNYEKRDENGNLDENGHILVYKYTRSIYYNKTYGILQLKDRDKVLFTINN